MRNDDSRATDGQREGVPEGYTAVRTETLNWLLGESGDFECPPEQYFRGKPAPYFWRKGLRAAMLAAAPTPDIGMTISPTPPAGDAGQEPKAGEHWHVRLPNAQALTTSRVVEVTPATVLLRHDRSFLSGIRYVRSDVAFIERAAIADGKGADAAYCPKCSGINGHHDDNCAASKGEKG